MSGFAEALQGFGQGGGLTSILKLATMGANVAGQHQESEAEAAAILSKGRDERIRATAEALQLKKGKRRAISTQRAKYAKAGIDVTQGSPLAVMADTAGEFEKDINLAMRSGKMAYSLARSQAGNVKKASLFKMGPTILSGVSEFFQGPLFQKV